MKSKYRKLEKIYAKIPKIECKGFCSTECTIIVAYDVEIKRIKERLKKNIFFKRSQAEEAFYKHVIDRSGCHNCAALKDNRCSIYDARPLICRMFGVSEGLTCKHDCKPGRILTFQEAHDIMSEVEAL